mmetsp:Transcript_30748/g.82340  ORF Transcript_30748/g.82340 Transcript_30748/m.82340 type:complete len:257 (+) Transcript_30748:476-1246(+)
MFSTVWHVLSQSRPTFTQSPMDRRSNSSVKPKSVQSLPTSAPMARRKALYNAVPWKPSRWLKVELTISHTIHRKWSRPKNGTLRSRNLPIMHHFNTNNSPASTNSSTSIDAKVITSACCQSSAMRTAAISGSVFTARKTGSSRAVRQSPMLNNVQTSGDSSRRFASASMATLSGEPLPFFLRNTAWPPLFPVLIVSGGKYCPGAASVLVPRMARWPTVTPGQSTQLSRTLAPRHICTPFHLVSSSQTMPTFEPNNM